MLDESKKISTYEEQKAFVELIRFCDSNRGLFSAIHEDKEKLTPLVGAGLSRKFGYPSWKEFFENMLEKDLDPNRKVCIEIESILDQIKKGKKQDSKVGTFYTKMADLAISDMGKEEFFLYLERKFEDKKLLDIENSTAHIIAKIFDGLCLTTNFDRVMEKACARTGRNKVFSPGEEEEIKNYNQSRNSKEQRDGFLYHLHGSVKDACTNPERIVLTTESYEKYYGQHSEKTFIKMQEGLIIFYLGIGLENEEPFIDFFKKNLGANRYHYAVYSATKEEANELFKKLKEEQKIRALIYPKGEYSYLEHILNWLQKEIPTRDEIKQWENKMCNEYDWPTITYIDESKNLSKLGEFLDNDLYPFRYAEITGGSWSGKTRLAEELKKKAESKKWEVISLNGENISSLTVLPSEGQNILYIFDDSTTYSIKEEKDKIKFCKYLMDLAKNKKKLRLVFLYTSLENPEKWWENVININPEVSLDIYFWDKITLGFTEQAAEEIISSFAEEHEKIIERICDEKINKCFEIWKEMIKDKETPQSIQAILKTPHGCMLITYITISNNDDKEEIKNRVRKSLMKIGLPAKDIDKMFSIWQKKYKELFNVIINSRENTNEDPASSSPPTSLIMDIDLNKEGE